MLLLFLYLCLHYDLLHCDHEKADIKDSFLDYSITEFWWNGTPGIDQTDRITARYSLLPTPYGHGQFVGEDGLIYDETPDSPPEPTVSSEESKKFTLFPNMTRASYPFSIDKYTVAGPLPRPPPLPSEWHINYPGLTPPPNFPSDYRYPTVFPTMHDATHYSFTGSTPRRPSFTLPFVSRPELTYPTLFTTSTTLEAFPEEGSEGRMTTTPEPETTGISWDPAAAYVSMWKEKLSSEVVFGTTPLDVMPKLRAIFSYDYTTDESPLAIRRAPSTSRRDFNSDKVTVAAMPAIKNPGSGGIPSYDPDNLAEKPVEQKKTKHTQTLTAARSPMWGN